MLPRIEKTANPAMNDVIEHETERNTLCLNNNKIYDKITYCGNGHFQNVRCEINHGRDIGLR